MDIHIIELLRSIPEYGYSETALPARNCNYSAKQWNPKPILHIFNFNNILIENQWGMSSQNQMSSLLWEFAYEAFDYQTFLIIIEKLLLIC